MSDCERYGSRDLTYSNWHRTHSIKRFVGIDEARRLTMIDLDGLEYCNRCRECVGVIEVARDVGQAFKASSVTSKLAHRLGVPGLLTFYRISDHQVSDGNGEHLPDIDAFRVRIVAPVQSPEREITPEQYARWISAMHRRCPCQLSVEAAA
jgi:hypothetical protein